MAKNSEKEVLAAVSDAPMAYGADASVDASVSGADSSVVDPSTGADSSAAAEPKIQGRNMQTSTVVIGEDNELPTVDTAAYHNKAKFTVNGDIREGGKSILAEKMVNAAQGLKTSKSVMNPFPATGEEYLKTLDYKVNP